MLNKNSGLKDKILAILIAVFGATGAAQAQEAISGPSCVVVGVQYSYTLSGPASTFTYDVNGGSVSNASYMGTSYSKSLTLLVTWGASNPRTITLYSTIDNNTITITSAPSLVSGAITSGQSQTINYGSTPAAIDCAASTGGSCSPVYSYQWQSSTDNVNFSNISGATGQNLTFSSALTATTYYRRMVTESGGSTGYSNTATVTVYPALIAGSISPASQSISYGSNATTLTLTGVSGGSGSYTYQWESSPDNATWTPAGSTATAYTPLDVTATTYYRVLVTSNGVTGSGSSAVVNAYPALTPGTISPSNVTIASGSSPGAITGTAASGGGCSGSYNYQWLTSTDGTNYTAISGATAASYTPPALSANAWYLRQVSCSGISINSNICQVVISSGVPDMNCIISRSIAKPGVKDSATAASLTSPYDVSQTTQFFDGIDRLVQTVTKQQTPLQKDMVSINAYDNYGREANQYLPYPATTNDGNYKATAFSDQYNFNVVQYPGEQYYYSEINFEPSPLDRPLTTYAPGINWLGAARGVNVQHLVNQVSDSVRIWNIAYPVGSIPTSTAAYPAGTLYKTVTTDEEGHQVVEYKDKTEHTILKKVQSSTVSGTAYFGWLSTYYVYDDVNNLRFVMQPQEVLQMAESSSWVVSPTNANTYCFRYEYDLRNRTIIKKVPGAGEVHMVYDERDRLIMSQDSNLRSTKQWLVTTYDGLNRTDSVGLLTDPTNYNNLPYYTAGALTTMPYPFIAGYPAYTVENFYHYDDYAWVTALNTTPTATMDTSYNSNPAYFITSYNNGPLYAVPLTPFMITRGGLTGRTDYLLGTNQAQYTVNFYDDRGRAIEVQSTNYFRGLDKDITQYDFSGKPLRHLLAAVKNGNNSQTHKVLDQYSYDAALRLTGIRDNIDGLAFVVDTLQYNELGQLQKKTLGSGLDSLVYAYNIRGWLTGINKNYVAGTAKDYFGLELAYDKQTSVSTTTYAAAQYNGNITGLIWKSAGDQTDRKYDFTYDDANRLLSAGFLQNPSGSTWNKTAMDYSVGYLNYDANGNIYGMDQWGFKVGAPTGLIDELSYQYQTNSNQLSRVVDLVNDTASTLGDFHYKTKGAYDYLYDGNGNLKIDNNKGIDSIGYNYLNLPQYVHMKGKGTIQYAYSTDGEKWAKIVTDSTQSPVKVTTTSYLKTYQYINDTLEQYNFDEGRQRWQKLYQQNGDSLYSYVYDYFMKDHLGDTRVILTTEKDTAQYMATMEPQYRTMENALFYNIDSTSYAANLVPGGGFPAGNGETSPNDSVAMVSGSPGDHTQGPAILLKVMSGDSIAFGVNSYYVGSGAANNPTSSLPSVLNSLAGGLVSLGAGGGESGVLSALNNSSGSPVYAALTNFLPSNDSTPANKPKAYLNWMLLDNQFNYVSGNGQSGAMAVGTAGTVKPLANAFKLQHSGYLYIWVSNETPNWDVFFDDLSIEHFSGPMLEETHYYPFGLTMAGISDKAIKSHYAENKYRYNKGNELQNKEFSDGSGLELYDARHRMLDPQLGRFGQIDQFADMSENMSTYTFGSDNPISRNDPFGLKDSIPMLKSVTVIGHKNPSSVPAPVINLPQINDMREPLDHLAVARNIPAFLIPSPNTLLGRITILERSKKVSENGEKVADAAKAIANILKSLLEKGSLGAKELGILEDYAGYGGTVAAAAQGVLDIAQGITGEVTPEECGNSLMKLGFTYGVGFLGDALGGPVLGAVLSFAAEKLLDEVDKVNKESYELNMENSTPIGYENITFHP